MTGPASFDRRRFLRGAGQAAVVVGGATLFGSLLEACSSSGGTTPVSTTTSTTTSSATAADWAALGGALSGSLVLPSNPAYGVDKQLYNPQFDDLMPAAIAYCQTATDVQRCVGFARQHGVELAARSGGHSYGGYSLCPGLVVDVSRMANVAGSSARGMATIGAGAKLVDIYNTLGNSGMLLPGGSCPTVGIAGLALGGGQGVFGRKYGLTCDNIASLQMVTADGTLRTCDPEHNPDLYWASRGGGGGNYGIVTSFDFTVHPIPPVALFTLQWPFAAAAEMLEAWQQWIPTTPDELWSNCLVLSQGSAGAPIARVGGVFAGAPATLKGILAPLLSAVGTTPTTNFVGAENYVQAMMIEAGCEGDSEAACHLQNQNPAGILERSSFNAKSAYVHQAIPSSGAAAIAAAALSLSQSVPEVGGGFAFDSYGGAINRVAAPATAFVHRDALACIQYSVSFSSTASSSVVNAGQAWLTSAQRTLAPYTAGAYQNYIDPTLADWQQEYYGSNLPRLVKVKAAYDPDDVFHFAQSIPTTLT